MQGCQSEHLGIDTSTKSELSNPPDNEDHQYYIAVLLGSTIFKLGKFEHEIVHRFLSHKQDPR